MSDIVKKLENMFEGGVFPVFISPSETFEGAEIRYSSFFLALMLAALVNVPETKKITDILADTLKKEMSELGSWNYWIRASEQAKKTPFPDDLDTTSCSIFALAKYDSTFLSGDTLGRYVQLLMAVERDVGGPYRTWLVPEEADDAWKDVDPAVNSNIAVCLSLADVELEGLNRYLKSAVTNSSVSSPYYPSRIPFLYFLSRGVKGLDQRDIRQEIEMRITEACTPLELAMMTSALIKTGGNGEAIAVAIQKLRADLQLGLCERAYPLCIDSIVKGTLIFAGSPALTLALTLEALSLANTEIRESHAPDERLERLFVLVKARVQERFGMLPEPLRSRAQAVVSTMLEEDARREKSMFGYIVAKALGKDKEIDDDFFLKISLAHFYGWLAYTIYDNAFDDELEKIDLSIANISLRELTILFNEVLPQKLVAKVLDAVDGANAWEVTNCRLPVTELPDFTHPKTLVDRSWGMILAPLAVFSRLGYAFDAPEVQAFENYLQHFILAKQLNDDAHDWEEDFTKGRLTLANVEILKRLDGQEMKLEEMRKIFWFEVIDELVKRIQVAVSAGEGALELLPRESRGIFQAFILPFQVSAAEALKERERAMQFIQTLKL